MVAAAIRDVKSVSNSFILGVDGPTNWLRSCYISTVLFLLGCGVASCTVCDALAAESPSPRKPFELEDYFRIRRVSELAISEDGSQVAYVTEMRSLEDNKIRRVAYLQLTREGAAPITIGELADARHLIWIPDTGELAFLSNRVGTAQVFAYHTKSGNVRQLTHGPDSVVKFRAAPDGTAIAYLTVTPSESLYDQMRRDGPGIVIDTDTIGFMDMVDAGRAAELSAGARRFWVTFLGMRQQAVEVAGDVQDFHWSSDAHLLSVTYVAVDVPASLFRRNCTSIGIYDVSANRFTPFAVAVRPTDGSRRSMYLGGEWIPGLHRIVVRRVTEQNPWLGDWAFPKVTIADVGSVWRDDHASWMPVELYPRISRFSPKTSGTIYIETRLRAVDTLITLTEAGTHPSGVADDLPGSSSLFRFSTDFKTAVFVNESLNQPPELYVRVSNARPRQLTRLNDELSRRVLPYVTEVRWTSSDNTEVSGWLLKPHLREQSGRWPLLTYVHGGPAAAFPNRFAPLSNTWPYPFEVLALRGIAVFIPQYRGTLSFGRKVARPSKIDEEPSDDIVTGIEFLIREGIADRTRLGIAGHSHGGWLGPMVATRTRMFRAASFAEGWSNQVTLFELNSGRLNREVHQEGIGEPALYEQPERYLELAPDLHFRGLPTASLFEAGAEAIAMQMLGMPKAARYFGIPSEFVIYPNTGHAMTIPRLQRESAERNLDWFRFWLLGEESPDLRKDKQYARWRSMRIGMPTGIAE